MKLFIFFLLSIILYCNNQSTKVAPEFEKPKKYFHEDSIKCKQETKNMIIGNWEKIDDVNLKIKISTDSITYLYGKDETKDVFKIKIINESKNCNELLPNYPPSWLRIVEYTKDNLSSDSTILHIIDLNNSKMELATENNDIILKKTK
ncbi:hypothetical protein SAMN05421847_0042 [Halpernia humi]|uniref:Uncharacterized protein n=1 Tax=Halpernia humi TaxID=493375 RepID=A0A1H5S4A9_9FLAO|nr:hypothetical protein [Halpernia humi]SEF45425.1 hypothetical protein SAMN05421847_0042 [Halpernia humi]